MDLVLDLLATVSRWSRSNLSEISLALVGCLLVLFGCLLYTSPSPRDRQKSRMPSSA